MAQLPPELQEALQQAGKEGPQKKSKGVPPCENCGYPLKKTDKRCPKCGAPVPRYGKAPPEYARGEPEDEAA